MLPIAERWFERRRIDDDVTLLWEPHVIPLLRCNIWHVRGRDLDLLIDTGLGIVSLRRAAADLFGKPVLAVATHTHTDHVGGHHEWSDCLCHAAEAEALRAPKGRRSLRSADSPPDELRQLREAGYEIGDLMITALPYAGYDLDGFRRLPATPTRVVEEGAVIDTGDRRFEVLHLPGHSPGSIGLWEAATGTLFSGDALYDGPLLDTLPGSDRTAYRRTMERLRGLPVRTVHAGHDPSFGPERMRELIDGYLRSIS
ncbi:MBL fold metallo-hydrolase [Azospirillum sp.]|uniref:MBL fold metallo-hydrolase n=1 Tax=Azospirillum sp. TaxID=34012 RepID=UPI003D75B0C8